MTMVANLLGNDETTATVTSPLLPPSPPPLQQEESDVKEQQTLYVPSYKYENNNNNMIAYLISKGVDINQPWGSTATTAMHVVKSSNIARQLIDHGADVHATDMFRRMPLHVVYSVDIAKLLIEYGGADVNGRNKVCRGQ